MKISINFLIISLIIFSNPLYARSKYLEVRLHADAQSATNPLYSNSSCTNISRKKVNADEMKRYVIIPGSYYSDGVHPYHRIVDSDDNFQILSNQLRSALTERGFQEVSRAEDADIEINLSYGILIKSTHVSPRNSSVTSGTISSSGSSITYSGTTIDKPISSSSTKGAYTRIIKLDANPAYVVGKGTTCVWEITAHNDSSTKSIDDFREMFPYFIEAMKPYIGRYREEYFFNVRVPINK